MCDIALLDFMQYGYINITINSDCFSFELILVKWRKHSWDFYVDTPLVHSAQSVF